MWCAGSHSRSGEVGFGDSAAAVYTVHVNTVHKILDAAQRLHDEQGFDAVSMRNVADAVGVVPAAIYRHYKDKDALLNAMVDAGFELLETYFLGARNVNALMRRFVQFALEQPRLYQLMFQRERKNVRKFPDDFRAGRSRSFTMLEDAVAAAMKRGDYRKGDPLETAFTIWAQAHGLISMYTLGRFSGDAAQFVRFYERSMRRVLDGIRKGRT